MREKSLTAVILSLILILFFHDIVFQGKTLSASPLVPGAMPDGPYGYSGHRPGLPFSFDTGGNAWVNEPNPYIIRNMLHKGIFPAWNPYEGIGMPLIGNLNNEIFNPLKFFLNFFPNAFSQDIFFLLRLLVMGLFTYLFLRERKLSFTSSFLGSSFFMLSGYSVWWINLHPLSTVMYLPPIFYFYERWQNRKDLISPFLMSLSLSFALISGKIPDAIMGVCLLFLYAVWKGFATPAPTLPLILRQAQGDNDVVASLPTGQAGLSNHRRGGGIDDIFGSIFKEGGKIVFISVSGALMSALVLLPFIELYAYASPLAKALRTGAASHTLPLITSASFLQPLFLGWGNYFYDAWMEWTPQLILPHAGLLISILAVYASMNRLTLLDVFPFLAFSSVLFLAIFGALPSHIISKLPILRSIEFLKYNAMLYFSLAIMAAHAFDSLLSADGKGKKFYLSIGIVSLMTLAIFFCLYGKAPQHVKGYMKTVLFLTLSGMILLGLAFYFFRKGRVFAIVVFIFLTLELFLYMPKDHPDRYMPFREPPYAGFIKESSPYRFAGSGTIMPPLVSSAEELFDVRGISVLLPHDYYIFFENLLSFSVPQTNNPSPFFFATSPFIDLAGVKYILSPEPLAPRDMEKLVSSHVASMRWIRFFDAMIEHAIKGGATYGFFNSGGEERFSFFFPLKFAFESKIKVTEPFIFAGFRLKDAPKGTTVRVKISAQNKFAELTAGDSDWKEQWLDVSDLIGKVIVVNIEGYGTGGGSVVLGNFGLSPGPAAEKSRYEKLLMLHNREYNFLKYVGSYEGIHIYENSNVMERAFIVRKFKQANNLDNVISELREGLDFRESGLVTPAILSPDKRMGEEELSLSGGGNKDDKVMIKKYTPNEITIDADSKGGLLVLSDLYYPGWRVKVNGQDKEVIKAFGLLRGVIIDKGNSKVIFYYRPLSFYSGIIISLTTFIAWLLFSYLGMKRRHV